MKKAILVVSFGTTYRDGMESSIESIENKIRVTFPDYEVRRAFTSRIIIRRLAVRDGLQIDNEREALQRLQDEGYQEVYIQPLHVVVGEEYDKVKKIVVHAAYNKSFQKISIGRPLLYYTGQRTASRYDRCFSATRGGCTFGNGYRGNSGASQGFVAR